MDMSIVTWIMGMWQVFWFLYVLAITRCINLQSGGHCPPYFGGDGVFPGS
ncbi:MAG: hypothetical protein QNJ51_16410 [Calothrix sp. MO_167.B12]|nr:hypothetical protein [Calothrix sp. MO_167.B12]